MFQFSRIDLGSCVLRRCTTSHSTQRTRWTCCLMTYFSSVKKIIIPIFISIFFYLGIYVHITLSSIALGAQLQYILSDWFSIRKHRNPSQLHSDSWNMIAAVSPDPSIHIHERSLNSRAPTTCFLLGILCIVTCNLWWLIWWPGRVITIPCLLWWSVVAKEYYI